MARRAHRSSILSSSRTPDQLRVPRSEHLVHFSRRRCFEHNQRPEHLTCRRPRLDVARRAHPWPGTWCTYRRSQYERYSLAVTSDGKVGPSGVVLRPPHGSKRDNVTAGSAGATGGSSVRGVARRRRQRAKRTPCWRACGLRIFWTRALAAVPQSAVPRCAWGGGLDTTATRRQRGEPTPHPHPPHTHTTHRTPPASPVAPTAYP